MKHTKRILSVLLALVLLLCSVPAAFAADVVDSGTCEGVWNSTTKTYTYLTWSLDSAGTLTISGEGEMGYYGITYESTLGDYRTNAPWGKYYQTIQSVAIGDSVTSIGYYAFYNCTAMESVTIGNSVTSIGNFAFQYCSALESVTMGNSVTSIGDSAFSCCSNLSTIYLTDLSAWLGSSNLSNITTNGKAEKAYYFNGEPLTDVVVPDGVTQIPAYAFYNCKTLSSVTIPDSVTSIGNYAFEYCTALESVTIPDSVTSIGEWAFYGCTALESVTLPDNITSIGGAAFSGNNSWYTIALCNKDTTTAATFAATGFPYAFLDGTDEDNLIFEKANASLSFTIDKRTRTMTVQTNGVMVSFASFSAPWLEYQKYITDVVILPGCTSVSARAFQRCYNLKRVTLPDGIESIGASAFYECYRLMQINLPDSVETIGSEAFRYCTALESVTIGNGVTSIGNSAFYGCTALESVTIPDSVTSIGNSAFYGCSAMESVTIPDSVTSIGNSAFYGCSALTSIDLGSGLTSIGEYAFSNSGLESIVIPDSVKTLNGRYYDSNFYYYYGYTFASCRSLKTVVIGDGLTDIPANTFSGCSALETVSIGDGVQGIYPNAFSGCTALETVSFGENVTAIYDSAFSGCTSLHTVVLPEKVTSLSSRSFPEKALKDLYIYNSGACDIAEDAVYFSATIHAYPDSPAANFFESRGYTFEPLTDAPAHEHDSTLVKGTAPTCTEAGLTDGYQCSICGKWITKQKPIKALGHDYVLKQTVPPTDTENGFNRYECSRCKASYTEVIPVSSHAHNYTVIDSRPATCTEDGFTSYVCYGCGHSYTEILAAPGHSFGAWKTFLPMEAGQAGIDVRFCSVCGAYELRESETAGTGTVPVDPTHTHNYVAVETKNATCENAGYVRSLCACGDSKVEILDALGHEDKNKDGKCDRCGIQTGTPANPCAYGHDLGDWVVRSEPTCTQSGYKSKYCKNCNQVIVTEEIAKLGHAYRFAEKRDATCTEEGTETMTCTRCGDQAVSKTPPLGHIDENDDGKCDRCGEKLTNGEEEDLNFFQRIIQWFKDLFNKLFGKK